MKKIALFLILLVQLSWAQTPIYQWNFNNSLSDVTNTYTFASSPNVAGSYTTDRFGNSNSAYVTPQGSQVQLSIAGLTNLPQGSNPRTLSVWMKFNASSQSDIGIFEYGTQTNNQTCGLTQIGSNNPIPYSLKAYGFANDFNASSYAAIYNYATTNAEWYHYVLTYDIGMLRVYRNGNLLIEQNSATWNTQGNTLRLLSSIATNLSRTNYSVAIDDLKIYNSVLSQTQINQMYQTDFPATNTNLIAYFPLNNSYNATIGNYAFAPVNSGSLSYVTGVNGQAVNIGNSNALANGGGLGSGDLGNDLSYENLTVSFWMKRNTNASNAYETASELFGSLYFRDRPGSIQIGTRREFGVAQGTVNGTFNSNSTFFDENLLGKWVHVAQVFKNVSGDKYLEIYINGELKAAKLLPLSSPIYKYNLVVALGGGTDSGANFIPNKYANIAIDEVMYFNRALSFPEILSLRYYEPSSCPTGNVTLTTQAEVDALASCTTITGNLTINGGGNALNLAPLNNITSITGTLLITGVSNNQVNIFPNLTTVGNGIAIQGNTFQQFGGFNSFITLTSGSLQFSSNSQLQTISGFNSLINLTSGNLGFAANNNLETINAFSNLQTVNGLLIRNTKLINLNFLSSLQNNNGQLSIEGNSLLTNATFPNMVNHNFSNGTTGQRYLRIQNNPVLTTIGSVNMSNTNTCESIIITGATINNVSNLGTASYSVNGLVQIANTAVTNLNFVQNLTSCGSLQIANCNQLTNLNGLDNLNSITGQGSSIGLSIVSNSNLETLNGLSSNLVLTNLPINLNNNAALNNMSAFSAIPVSGVSSLSITSNPSLSSCASAWLCSYVATAKPFTIFNNATGCESFAVVNFACATLSTSDFDLNEISLYPNPTNSVFNLEIPNEVVKQVEIYDFSGKKLLKTNQHQIDVSSFATGIYMVQIQTESGKTRVSKLIKK